MSPIIFELVGIAWTLLCVTVGWLIARHSSTRAETTKIEAIKRPRAAKPLGISAMLSVLSYLRDNEAEIQAEIEEPATA